MAIIAGVKSLRNHRNDVGALRKNLINIFWVIFLTFHQNAFEYFAAAPVKERKKTEYVSPSVLEYIVYCNLVLEVIEGDIYQLEGVRRV